MMLWGVNNDEGLALLKRHGVSRTDVTKIGRAFMAETGVDGLILGVTEEGIVHSTNMDWHPDLEPEDWGEITVLSWAESKTSLDENRASNVVAFPTLRGGQELTPDRKASLLAYAQTEGGGSLHVGYCFAIGLADGSEGFMMHLHPDMQEPGGPLMLLGRDLVRSGDARSLFAEHERHELLGYEEP